MSDTRALLERISTFRRRLEATPHLVPANADEQTAAATLAASPAWLSHAMRTVVESPADVTPPPPLTNHARRLLESARSLVADQRTLAADPLLAAVPADDPLAAFHRNTVAMTDAALRLVQAFPASAEAQGRLCHGVDGMLTAVRDRLAVAGRAVTDRRKHLLRVDRLAKMLAAFHQGRAFPLSHFAEIGEEILEDARKAAPLRFPTVDPTEEHSFAESPAIPAPARFVACHALNVAAVVARVAPHDFEFSGRPLVPVVAALLMDVGMVAVPPHVLAAAGPLTADERRVIERHPVVGADLIRRAYPDSGGAADAVAAHHERLDGTGYPHGKAGEAVPPLARLLAVCDVYTASATDRPHRPAAEPRSALTDVLLAAEEDRLDRDFAETLMAVGFHPVGAVVELTDGRLAAVVANHTNRANPRATARPVVAVLCDDRGEMLPRPEVIDLAAADFGSVVRAVPTAERRAKLADRYPELCW